MAEQRAANQKQHQGQCSAHALHSCMKKLTIAEQQSSTETVSITNIYYDCLEHIFDYLDLQSLMNVAATCKRLKIAAAAKFSDDHGEKEISLIPSEYMTSCIFIESQEIQVFGLKFCRSFLWSFGAKISHLYFCEVNTSSFFESLEQDINKYCANTLKTLKFGYRHYKPTFSLENNPKPFQHVKKVGMEVCDLHGNFARVNTMFPNLRHLVLAEIHVEEDFSSVSIPQLERLDISLTRYFDFGFEEATHMIKANRQLQELQISSVESLEVKLAELSDTLSENTSISKLSVRLELTNVITDELMRLAAEHPLMVDLDLRCCRMTADDVIAFICKLDSLKKLQFKLVDGSQYDAMKGKLDEEWKIARVNEERDDVPVRDRITYILKR